MKTGIITLALLLGAVPDETTVVKGTVKIKGTVPRNGRVSGVLPECAAMHVEPLRKDDILADAEGRVQWAFVHVKMGLEGRKSEASKAPVVVDNIGCHYVPRVFGVMVGQPVLFRNQDPFLHNVHVMPFVNAETNMGLPRQRDERTVTFRQPEVMVSVRCEVHPWMQGWAGVLEHPFYAATDEKGGFEIKGLPPGKYTLEAWHERCGAVTREIEVKAGGTATTDFELEPKVKP
jgi:plastocyanin